MSRERCWSHSVPCSRSALSWAFFSFRSSSAVELPCTTAISVSRRVFIRCMPLRQTCSPSSCGAISALSSKPVMASRSAGMPEAVRISSRVPADSVNAASARTPDTPITWTSRPSLLRTIALFSSAMVRQLRRFLSIFVIATTTEPEVSVAVLRNSISGAVRGAALSHTITIAPARRAAVSARRACRGSRPPAPGVSTRVRPGRCNGSTATKASVGNASIVGSSTWRPPIVTHSASWSTGITWSESPKTRRAVPAASVSSGGENHTLALVVMSTPTGARSARPMSEFTRVLLPRFTSPTKTTAAAESAAWKRACANSAAFVCPYLRSVSVAAARASAAWAVAPAFTVTPDSIE